MTRLMSKFPVNSILFEITFTNYDCNLKKSIRNNVFHLDIQNNVLSI